MFFIPFTISSNVLRAFQIPRAYQVPSIDRSYRDISEYRKPTPKESTINSGALTVAQNICIIILIIFLVSCVGLGVPIVRRKKGQVRCCRPSCVSKQGRNLWHCAHPSCFPCFPSVATPCECVAVNTQQPCLPLCGRWFNCRVTARTVISLFL